MDRRVAFFIAALALPNAALAQDSDADGVPDASDAEPCDNTVTAWVYNPAQGVYGQLLFEDLWPWQGDFDFNDVVLAHNTTVGTNAGGQVTRIRVELDVLALGATYDNGIAYQLPVPRAAIGSATLSINGGPATALTTWTTEAQATFTLAQSARTLFGRQGFINTDPSLPAVPPVHLSVDITLAAGQVVDLTAAPFDLFIFDTSRGVEVHRPAYRGTSRLNSALVGTSDDGTSPSRAFVTKNGIPFALAFPQAVDHPPEGVSIEVLYPNIVAFGASQGATNQDFYLFSVPGTAYPVVSTTPIPPGTVDLSCVNPAVNGACGAANGITLAWAPQGSALCSAGAASAVTQGPSSWDWTCQGSSGGTTASCSSPFTTSGANNTCAAYLASTVAEMSLQANPDSTAFPSNNVELRGRGTATNALPGTIATTTLVVPPLTLDYATVATVLQVDPRAYARVNYGICEYDPVSGVYVRASGNPVVRMDYTISGVMHAPQPIRRSVFEQAVASISFDTWSNVGNGVTDRGNVQIFAHGTAGDTFTSGGVWANQGALGGTPAYSYAAAYTGVYLMYPSSILNNYIHVTMNGSASTLWDDASTVSNLTARWTVTSAANPCEVVMVAPDGTFLSAQGSLSSGCQGPLP